MSSLKISYPKTLNLKNVYSQNANSITGLELAFR